MAAIVTRFAIDHFTTTTEQTLLSAIHFCHEAGQAFEPSLLVPVSVLGGGLQSLAIAEPGGFLLKKFF